MIKKQFTLYLENKVGILGKVCKALSTAKVNIEGISVSESTDVGLVQMVTSNGAETKRVLSKMNVSFTVNEVSLLALKNVPGALAIVAQKLAKLGININYVYGTGCGCRKGCESYVIISAPDLKKVEKMWKSLVV